MLTTVHVPTDPRVFHKEAKSLLKENHSVSVIAPFNKKDRFNLDGIDIITIKKPKSKLLHPITMLRVFVEGLKMDCNVFHCHEPGSLFVCVLLKIIKKTKLIYDAHEHYPSLIAHNEFFPKYIKKIVHSAVDVSEKELCKNADCIITVNESLQTRYKKFNKTIILFNVPSLTSFSNISSSKESNTIIYVGNVSKKRGLDKLLMSLNETKVKFPNVQLIIVGTILDTESFKEWVDSFVEEHGLSQNFKMVDWVPYEELADYINKSLIGIVLFQPTYYNNIIGLPNKLFEYMACGTAVIASCLPEIKRVVDETKCGVLVDPTDRKDITEKLIWLLENPCEAEKMGIDGRYAVENQYNWEFMEKRLFKLYEDLNEKSV